MSSSTYHLDYLNDYLSSYAELLEKSTSVSIETKRLCTMVYEIFKTLNAFKSNFHERYISLLTKCYL